MTRIVIILPAAGASRRMRGRDKLLEPVAGAPLLRVMALRALEVSTQVIVTLPRDRPDRAAALDDLQVKRIEVADADTGMSASLRAASRHIPDDASGVLVLPADMPDISRDDLARVVQAFEDQVATSIVQATSADGTPGHPVLFPADLARGFGDLSGDEGARSIVKANADRRVYVALPDNHAITDLDTPEAWAKWRAAK